MKRKHYIIISFLFVGSVVVVFALSLFSDSYFQRRNSFMRKFPPHVVSFVEGNAGDFSNQYIAGVTSQDVFLGSLEDPLVLSVLDSSFRKRIVHFNIPQADSRRMIFTKIVVDSPDFHLVNGVFPFIYTGRMDDWLVSRRVDGGAYFTHLMPLGDNSFVVRSVDGTSNENILGKRSGRRSSFKRDILEKQVDGIFCTDGVLSFSSESNILVYTYYYRNQFIVMDTSLNISFKGNTIDTITKAQLKVVKTNSKSVTLAGAPHAVNGLSRVWKKWLFNESKLLSNNEISKVFDNAAAIDVYSLADGKYKFSFYLHNVEGKRVKDFFISGNRLVALYDNHIGVYTIQVDYF